MPVYSLEGTPGSGKTLYAVQRIIPDYLKLCSVNGALVPRHIYTNIEGLKPALICALAGLEYDTLADYFHVLGEEVDENGIVTENKDLVRYWYYKPESIEWVQEKNSNGVWERHPNWDKADLIPLGSLVIIDEIQNYYSNRDFATTYSKKCIEYVTKNRHFGWSLWWMSQSVESVDVTFRRNTQYVYFLESMENYGMPNRVSIKMYEGWLAGDKTNTPPFAVKHYTKDKRYYNAYKSYVAAEYGEKRYKTNIFLNHKGFMIMVLLAVLGIGFTIYNGNPLSKLTPQHDKPKAEKSPAALTQAPLPSPTTSLSGGGGGVVDAPKPCYTAEFTTNGIRYLIVDGRPQPYDPSKHLELCGGI